MIKRETVLFLPMWRESGLLGSGRIILSAVTLTCEGYRTFYTSPMRTWLMTYVSNQQTSLTIPYTKIVGVRFWFGTLGLTLSFAHPSGQLKSLRIFLLADRYGVARDLRDNIAVARALAGHSP